LVRTGEDATGAVLSGTAGLTVTVEGPGAAPRRLSAWP